MKRYESIVNKKIKGSNGKFCEECKSKLECKSYIKYHENFLLQFLRAQQPQIVNPGDPNVVKQIKKDGLPESIQKVRILECDCSVCEKKDECDKYHEQQVCEDCPEGSKAAGLACARLDKEGHLGAKIQNRCAPGGTWSDRDGKCIPMPKK